MKNSFFNMVTNTVTEMADVQTQISDEPQADPRAMVENATGNTIENPLETITPSSHNNNDMPPDARRALIYLSQQGVVLHSNKPQLFDNIVRHQTSIRRHLSEIYCSLIIDERNGVTFVARADFIAENLEQLAGLDNIDNDTEQAELEGEDSTSMIQKRMLNVYDTLLLLNLRKYYQERQNLGETEIIIDVEKLESLMSPFLPLTDHGSKDKKKLTGRVEYFAKNYKLVAIKRGNVERYEITPMIRYVVNASLLQAMLDEYIALLGEMPDKALAEEINPELNKEQPTKVVKNQVKNETIAELKLPTENTAETLQQFGQPFAQQDSLF